MYRSGRLPARLGVASLDDVGRWRSTRESLPKRAGFRAKSLSGKVAEF